VNISQPKLRSEKLYDDDDDDDDDDDNNIPTIFVEFIRSPQIDHDRFFPHPFQSIIH